MTDNLTKEATKDFYSEKKECNIFKILGMQNGSENRHSNFLAWLLNPNESHGLGYSFIEKLFKELKIDNIDFSKINVIREDFNKNGRADIVIKNDGRVICVIEVKFGSKETNNQCKRYYEEYGNDCKYVFLDIDEQNYEELIEKYKKVGFQFNTTYRSATFQDHILPILRKIIEQSEDSFVKQVLEQYINLLNEKFYIIAKPEIIKYCLDAINTPGGYQQYKNYDNCKEETDKLIHNFIWHTVPDKYNEVLKRIMSKLGYKILLKWKENGSSLSFRFINEYSNNNNYDYHDNQHFYLDHRNNQITLYKQKNLNENLTTKEIVSQENYFNLPFDENLFNEENLKNEIEQFVNKNKITA